jgi:uncharacterized transporter YbjL
MACVSDGGLMLFVFRVVVSPGFNLVYQLNTFGNRYLTKQALGLQLALF